MSCMQSYSDKLDMECARVSSNRGNGKVNQGKKAAMSGTCIEVVREEYNYWTRELSNQGDIKLNLGQGSKCAPACKAT